MIARATEADRNRMNDLAKRISGLIVGESVGLVVPMLLRLAAHYATTIDRIPLKELRRMLESSVFDAIRMREGLRK